MLQVAMVVLALCITTPTHISYSKSPACPPIACICSLRRYNGIALRLVLCILYLYCNYNRVIGSNCVQILTGLNVTL